MNLSKISLPTAQKVLDACNVVLANSSDPGELFDAVKLASPLSDHVARLTLQKQLADARAAAAAAVPTP